ncbi:MAG: branched-chain amino acid ABC transporter permease [Pseudonocardiaceae bacterium]|nr:branched-chain amino acid ABC transporter permease [Pseudonocardiaceae bacterium]
MSSLPRPPARRVVRDAALVAVAVVALALPLYVGGFWLQLGSFAFAAAVGAIGLAILFGRVGQLSLAHAFFLAVGAYGYIWLASPSGDDSWGLGLPSLLALALAAVLASLAGWAFSPIAARLRGLYLGVASLALVFLGQHILFTAEPLTGGYNGRPVPTLAVGGVQLSGSQPELVAFNVLIGRDERLWYLTLAVLVVAAVFAVAVLRGRVGRAFVAIRDAEVPAATLGVNLGRYRAMAFALSSGYAGLAGALLALLFQRVVPDYWGLLLSLQYLAMVVIGGSASIGGAILGATFVSSLPILLQRYGDAIPGVSTALGSGLGPAVVAQFCYGALIIAVLVAEPRGLVALLGRIRRRRPGTPGADRRAEPEPALSMRSQQ